MNGKGNIYMPNRRIIKAKDLGGINIFQDPKRGTIFYDFITKKGYILTSSDVKTYTIFSAMLPLCIIVAFAAASLFSFNYAIAILIFLALYIAVEITFRLMFFYKLPVAENWHSLKKENIIVSMARNFNNVRLIILIIMLVLLTALMPLYANMEKLQGINLYACYLISLITFAGTVISIMALITRIKNNY